MDVNVLFLATALLHSFRMRKRVFKYLIETARPTYWNDDSPATKTFSSRIVLTVGGERLTVDPRRSWGPMLEWRLIGRPPPPGVPPGEEAHDGATRILGGIMRALSDSRRFGKALWTLKKLLSGDDGEAPNHQPPKTPESGAFGVLLLLTITTVTTVRVEQVQLRQETSSQAGLFRKKIT